MAHLVIFLSLSFVSKEKRRPSYRHYRSISVWSGGVQVAKGTGKECSGRVHHPRCEW